MEFSHEDQGRSEILNLQTQRQKHDFRCSQLLCEGVKFCTQNRRVRSSFPHSEGAKFRSLSFMGVKLRDLNYFISYVDLTSLYLLHLD